MRHAPTAKSWSEMRQRCTNPLNDKWKWYGGRGIKVCAEWRSYVTFVADMGERPPGKTIDRWPDVNGDYEPGNCRWATRLEQAANKRNNRILTVHGERLHLSEAARRFGLGLGTIWRRLQAGWSDEDAVAIPAEAGGARSPKRTGVAHNRKLSDEQRLAIAASSAATKELMAKYGVSKSLILLVRKTQEASNRAEGKATQ